MALAGARTEPEKVLFFFQFTNHACRFESFKNALNPIQQHQELISSFPTSPTCFPKLIAT